MISKTTKADLPPERVTELRDAVLALIEDRGTKAWCSETKGLRYSDFKVDDLNFQHVDGSHFGSLQYVTVCRPNTLSTPVFMIGWLGDEAPRVVFYVDGSWLSRLADLTSTGSH